MSVHNVNVREVARFTQAKGTVTWFSDDENVAMTKFALKICIKNLQMKKKKN